MMVSVLIPYYDREHVLDATLKQLGKQDHPQREVIVIDDGSHGPYIMDMCDQYSFVTYERLRLQTDDERGPNMAWRRAYELATGDFIIISHPEILVPSYAITRLIEQCEEGRRIAPLLYFLDLEMQLSMDTVLWRGLGDDIHELQSLPNFWSARMPWGNTNAEMGGWYNHTAFCGQYREYWDEIGFVPASSEPDADLIHLAKVDEERGVIVKQADFAVYHQHHRRIRGREPEVSVRIKRIQGLNKV